MSSNRTGKVNLEQVTRGEPRSAGLVGYWETHPTSLRMSNIGLRDTCRCTESSLLYVGPLKRGSLSSLSLAWYLWPPTTQHARPLTPSFASRRKLLRTVGRMILLFTFSSQINWTQLPALSLGARGASDSMNIWATCLLHFYIPTKHKKMPLWPKFKRWILIILSHQINILSLKFNVGF